MPREGRDAVYGLGREGMQCMDGSLGCAFLWELVHGIHFALKTVHDPKSI